MSLIWKATPPGKEQNLLNKILKSKAFNVNSTPSELKSQYKEFDHVSAETFRNHFNLTKAKLGIDLAKRKKGGSESDGAEKTSPSPKRKFKKVSEPQPDLQDDNFFFENPPILVSEYIDPDTEEQKLIVVAMMFGGCKNFNFKLSDDGELLLIYYDWPQCSYDLKGLFTSEISSQPVKAYTKINALKEQLTKLRGTRTEAPSGVYKIKLPFKVQTDRRTWKAEGFQTEKGTMAAVIDLTGHQSSYTINENDTSIVFKKI